MTITETDQIKQKLIDISRKFGVDVECNDDNSCRFTKVVPGMGCVIEDEIGLMLLGHHKNSGFGYSPTSQILRVSWEDDDEED
jgi:hypothetical protein